MSDIDSNKCGTQMIDLGVIFGSCIFTIIEGPDVLLEMVVVLISCKKTYMQYISMLI